MNSESALTKFLNLLSLLSQQRSLDVSHFRAGSILFLAPVRVCLALEWLLVGPQGVQLLATCILALLCMLLAEKRCASRQQLRKQS